MNKSEFQEKLLASDKPVIVDFWAGWCAPCMVSKPVLEKIAQEYTDKIQFMPVNADDSREVLEQFRVYGIPTVITFRGGKEVGRVTGAQGEANYRTMFEALADGREVKIPLTPFNRMLRLGLGGLFVAIGISTGSWVVAGAGALLAFMGIYDRCPIWNAITGIFKQK